MTYKLVIPEDKEEIVQALAKWYEQKKTTRSVGKLAKLVVLKDVLTDIGCTFEEVSDDI